MRLPGTLLVFKKIIINKEEEMKKIIMLILIIIFLAFSFSSMVIGKNAAGPAPNSGDCVPDGSGFKWDDNGEPVDPDFPFGSGDAPGPAPNSGDGIPDGPGW